MVMIQVDILEMALNDAEERIITLQAELADMTAARDEALDREIEVCEERNNLIEARDEVCKESLARLKVIEHLHSERAHMYAMLTPRDQLNFDVEDVDLNNV